MISYCKWTFCTNLCLNKKQLPLSESAIGQVFLVIYVKCM